MGGSVKIKNRSGCLCDGQEAQLHATNHGAACQTVVKSGSATLQPIVRLLQKAGAAQQPRCLKRAWKDTLILN